MQCEGSEMSAKDEDIDYWMKRAKDVTQMLEGKKLSRGDEQRLEQIRVWCKLSPLLWKIIERIGWEINEG